MLEIRGLKKTTTIWLVFVYSKKIQDWLKQQSCYNSCPHGFEIMLPQLLIWLGGVMVYCWGKLIALLTFGGWYHNLFTNIFHYSILVPYRNIRELFLVVVLKATIVHWNQTWTRTSDAAFMKAWWVMLFLLRAVRSWLLCSINIS